jgi:carbonic anhydrase/acetyltransferase-like protein (isoleucine patch superfamily)
VKNFPWLQEQIPGAKQKHWIQTKDGGWMHKSVHTRGKVTVKEGAIVGNDSIIEDETIIHEDARIGSNVFIGMYAHVYDGAIVGDDSYVCRKAVVGPGARIGHDAFIGAEVTVPAGAVVKAWKVLELGAREMGK